MSARDSTAQQLTFRRSRAPQRDPVQRGRRAGRAPRAARRHRAKHRDAASLGAAARCRAPGAVRRRARDRGHRHRGCDPRPWPAAVSGGGPERGQDDGRRLRQAHRAGAPHGACPCARPARWTCERAGGSFVRATHAAARIDRPQEAHLLTARLSAPGGPAAVPFPFLCLLASGGHTILVLAKVCCGSCSAASCRCFRKVHIARGRCCSLWATTSGWEARWTTLSARLSTRWPEISECPGKWMESRHRQGRRWRHWREQVLTLPSPACCAQHASCVTAAVLSPAREYVQATPAQSSHRSRCQCERSRANAPTATSVSLG